MNWFSMFIAIVGSVSLTLGSMFQNQWLMYLCSICFLYIGVVFSK